MMYKHVKALGIALLLVAATSTSIATAQYTSKPIDSSLYTQAPYKYTGASYTAAGACSGAVVADTRVLLSASHCVFNEGLANPWTGAPEWFLRYGAPTSPISGQGKRTRGYWYFASYADAVRDYTMASPESFDLDYIAAYSYDALAEQASPYVLQGYEAILALPWKQTVGYPSGLYARDHPNRYLMHANGPWTAQCYNGRGSYIWCDEVSSGPGNSGGPVFVWDADTAAYYFAGVLVSGLERSRGDSHDISGINAMTQDEWSLVNSAIDSANKELPGDGQTGAVDGNNTPGGASSQRLSVYGNASLIQHGSKAATRGDMTDFGSVTGSRTLKRTFILSNVGTTLLTFSLSKPASISGKSARYFKIKSQMRHGLMPNESQNLKIEFASSPRGLHRATVVVKSDDPQTPAYRFAIQARRR